jgi:prevent-host-death family protein
MKTMAAGKFKATCLKVMDEVQAKREQVVITKNGKPVAKLVPVSLEEPDPIFGFYKGKLEIVGDIMSPGFDADEWDSLG